MGFGAKTDRMFSGASTTAWIGVLEIQGLRLEYPGIHMKTGEGSFAFGCDAPVWVRDLLVSRWFQLATPAVKERKDCTWSRLAVRKDGLSVRMGRLAILTEGLCFVPAGAPVELLIPRRREGVLELIEPTRRGSAVWLLLVGTDASNTGEWVVQEPLGCIQELEEHLVDPAWFPPDNQADNSLLEGIIGPASYVNLWRGHQKLAGRERVPVAPFGGKLRMKLDGVVEPPPLPFAVRLEVANARGRFLLTGMLREWQPVDPKRNRRAPPTERQILVVLEREIISDNRRQFYRLPLNERLPFVLLSAIPSVRNPDPVPELLEGVVLLDLSRKGASLWFPGRISDEQRVSFELTIETLPEAPQRDEDEATIQAGELEEEVIEDVEAVTIESFHLYGAIAYGIPWKLEKESGWRIGVRFDENADGFGAFDVRQRAFLRQRADEREARGL